MEYNKFWRIFLPYCLQRLKDGSWIVLNRNYKPLGVFGREWATYETDRSCASIRGLTKRVAAKISHKPLPDEIPDQIWLYDDSNNPAQGAKERAAYFKRLEALAAVDLKPGDRPQ